VLVVIEIVEYTLLLFFCLRKSSHTDFNKSQSEVAKAVFAVDTNGVLRDLKAVGRLSLFKLLALLVEKHAAILKRDMGGSEFAKGVVSMAELEKDPSCLRILFGLYEELGKNWVLDNETYLLIWESYVRYFPITLAKAATDPTVPKPDELRALLVSCFISNDIYAPEAFPRLIDMLDTNQDLSANTKVQELYQLRKNIES